MELLRKLILMILGFAAGASIAVMDDRMALNYGVESALDVNRELRVVVTSVREQWEEWTEIPEPEQEYGSLEVFVTQKI